MASKQEWLRERIVQFAETHTKVETVNHFLAENIPRSTVFSVLSTFNDRGTTQRQSGSGRPARIIAKRRQNLIAENVCNHADVSASELARKFNCSQQYMQKTIKKLGFTCYHRQKSPKYTAEQVELVKRHSRWMHDRYKNESFVLDDEKYFTLSGPQNGTYYARQGAEVPVEVKYKQQAKYEKKLMVYLAASERGISAPYFAASGLAITQSTYTDHCLKKILLPFLRAHHAD